jgi:hypothetical protein
MSATMGDTLAGPSAKTTNKQLSVSLSVEVYDALQEYRFANRIDRVGGVATKAIITFLQSEGFLPADSE